MNWTQCLHNAIMYIEANLTQPITIADIAQHVYLSPFYFQKGFFMLCDLSVSDYIRARRLSLAGSEIATTTEKIIDIAVKYGYDSPDSFTKAFTRFHGAHPTAVRKQGASIKTFAPLKIKFILEGGYTMQYKIVEKDAFTVVGLSKTFPYDQAAQQVPLLWAEFLAKIKNTSFCPLYGINVDEQMTGDTFEYLIADNYTSDTEIPDGFVTKVIPKLTWAVFTCRGAMPQAMQELNRKIYSEWLPSMQKYEISHGYCIEVYDDPAKYAAGTSDAAYTSELWIPVGRK